jgi:hypothetical protein
MQLISPIETVMAAMFHTALLLPNPLLLMLLLITNLIARAIAVMSYTAMPLLLLLLLL